MRVTFLTHYPQLYGANRSLLDLISGLNAYGVHSSVLVSGKGPICDELTRRNISFRVLPLGRWASRLPEEYYAMSHVGRALKRCRKGLGQIRGNVKALPGVIRQLRTWGTEVVYSNSSLLVSGAVAAKFLGLPHVWHLREFGELDYGFVPDLGLNAQKWFINRADGIVAISETIRNHYRLGDSSKIRVIHSGISWESEIDKIRRLDAHHVAHVPYTFALVGLLHPAKGQETAIYALHKLVQQQWDVRLLLAGSGPSNYESRLRQLVDRLDLQSRVAFQGFTDDVYSVYLESDAVLMCSKNEGLGRVTAEAMAACRPVIGFRNAGTSEVIRDRETGLLYDGGSSALAAAMSQFLEKPEWGRTLGLNGSERARELFTIERYAASVFDVIQHSLSMA